MDAKVPLSELQERIARFSVLMDKENPGWEMAALFSRINLFYFTGTMQDGMLLIPRDGDAVLWVRRSYERACDESLFPQIMPMDSFRYAAKQVKNFPATVFLETEVIPLALLQRFQRHFPFTDVKSLDLPIAKIRAVKSTYEITLMKRAGEIHRHVLEDCIPRILQEGMSEARFATEVYTLMIEEGHQGIVRFGKFDTEIVVGQIGFGESSIYPTCFDGPGGCYGMSPGVPVLGSRERKLRKGDLVFIDNACGVNGYQTDKTMTYMFKEPLSQEAIEAHCKCVDIQNEMASLLKPGNSPAHIYDTIMTGLPSEFLENFMGFGKRRVNFLGHGVGLVVDEIPVIARGFDEPLQERMVLALEPKKGIKDVGMVGIENTFVVTPQGGRSITGSSPGLILVN